MSKLTFADVKDKDKFTIYRVSRSGSITKRENFSWHGIEHFFNGAYDVRWRKAKLSDSTLHLSAYGNVSSGWGYAYFLNKEEAQAIAIKIATTRYDNTIKQIKTI